MSGLQLVIGALIILGSMIIVLSFAVREAGSSLQDIEDYEEDEPV